MKPEAKKRPIPYVFDSSQPADLKRSRELVRGWCGETTIERWASNLYVLWLHPGVVAERREP